MSTDRFRPYNPNPCGCRVGDCTVRAICKATGESWEHTYIALCVYGYMRHDKPTANHVWGAYLKDHGLRRQYIEDCNVSEFCRDHPEGTYILAIDGHVVCAVDGYFYDSWNSGQEVPMYYWTKG